jgi:type I restriction enzyme, S subunit
MSDDLPQAWAATKLDGLFEFKYGKGLPQEKRNGAGSVLVYGSNGVVGRHDHAITKGATIIIGRKGSVGEIHLSSKACWPIDTTYFIDEFPKGCPPLYWKLFLESLRLGQQEKSSAIPGISRSDIYEVEIAVPPVQEQQRIVAKLENVLGRVEACQQRLTKISPLLRRFRRAVLAAACSGRLTADWRQQNSTDDALLLLDKISSKRNEWLRERIVRGDREARRLTSKLGVHEYEERNEELPIGWAWTSLLRVCWLVVDCHNKTAPYVAHGIPLVRTTNVRNGQLLLDEVKFVGSVPEPVEK